VVRRQRFGIADQNASVASRLLNEAVAAGAISIQDQTVGTRSWWMTMWASHDLLDGYCHSRGVDPMSCF